MAGVSVRIARSADGPRWDEYVLRHMESGPYHLHAWQMSVLRAYRHRCFYLMAEDDLGRLRGVFPLILVKPPFLRGRLVSQPFCDYGGFLVDDDAVGERLVTYLLELARLHDYAVDLRFRERVRILDRTPGLDLTSFKSRTVLDLPSSSAELWQGFKSKLRSQVKKPSKEGLKFMMDSSSLEDAFYEVFARRMKELGSPVHSKTWISSVLEYYGERAHIGVVAHDDRNMGAGIILCCGDTVSIPWASTNHEYNSLSPNMLLYWGFLRYACDNGYRCFDFGRSTPGEGGYRFKEQWGGESRPLYWYASHDVGIRELAEKIWSRLPLSVTNRLGPWIRRYISL